VPEGPEVIVVIDSVTHALAEERDRLIARYLREILRDPQMEVLRKISDAELQGLAGYIVTSLSDYLDGDDEQVMACFDFIGNTCFQLSVPLLETAYALYILRDEVARVFAADQAPAEQTERANKFFDRLVLELLRRY
jgi:hypothetical protein